ncbi:uncharacterized protein LOC125560763 [Nematostella vectensis]|uniref:uncharacterized protein LOC125560763 n=1 Tax=Nematostella vectensis TaxID=45351 RepID=UPI002077047F|nr:uncharacterized protein LOC125560763 [Nematostella vectensis]
MAVRQLHKMEPTETVHYTKQNKSKSKPRQITECKYCGDSHAAGKCKAFGQVCSKCSKKNHFARVCMSTRQDHKASQPQQKPGKQARRGKQNVHQLEESSCSDDDDEFSSNDSLYTIQSNQKKRQYFAQVLAVTGDKTARQSIKFQLDTGATCSTLSLNDYNKLTKKQPEQYQTELRAYNQSTIKPMGQVKLHCTANGITRKVHFQIIKEAPTSLLSGRVCEALK